MKLVEKTIQVVFSETQIQSWRHHETLREVELLNRLREAGIPVSGKLKLRGCTHGRLTLWEEPDDDHGLKYFFRWTGLVEDKPAPRPFDDDDEDNEQVHKLIAVAGRPFEDDDEDEL
jgi:hypothetical protein